MIYSSYTDEDLIKLVELSEKANPLEIELAKRLVQHEKTLKRYDEAMSEIISIASME